MIRRIDEKVARTPESEEGVNVPTLGHADHRPKSAPLLDRFTSSWNSLSLERRFLIAAALSVGMSMLALGYWVERQIRSGWLQGMAETGAVYLEAILSPYLQGLVTSTELAEPQREAIAALLADTRLSRRVSLIKVWSRDGNLIFSTGRFDPREKLPPALLNRVRDGNVSVEIGVDDKGHHGPVHKSLLEIYAPMYRSGTREVIAIGEFYEFSRALENEIVRVKYATWLLIMFVALIIGVLLFVTVKRASRIIKAQQALLETNLARAAALAKRNNLLRRTADRARLRATLLNENYLAHIGADLHDGPIQMLALMMLKLPDRPAMEQGPFSAQRDELEQLIQKTLAELRNLSAGLVLPELRDLSLEATIRLAITRHEQQTATLVRADLGPLPDAVSEAVKVCAYRIIQEALTNAYKHAGGAGQFVQVNVEDRKVTIAISNGGGTPVLRSALSQTPSLGLRGMEARVHALRGTLSVVRGAGNSTEVIAAIPIRPQAKLESQAKLEPQARPESQAKPARSADDAPDRPN